MVAALRAAGREVGALRQQLMPLHHLVVAAVVVRLLRVVRLSLVGWEAAKVEPTFNAARRAARGQIRVLRLLAVT